MTEPSVETARRTARPNALAFALVFAWVVTAVLQRITTPTLGTEIALLVMVTPLMVWAAARARVDRARLRLLAVAALPVVHMFVISLVSENPTAALLGTAPHWHGWILWGGLLALLMATLMGADRRDTTGVAWALATVGGLTSVWALAEAAGLLPSYDYLTGTSAALFDSPLSMGQALLLTIAATVALALQRRLPGRRRLALWALVALQFAAVFAANARGALVGALMGVVAFGVMETGSSRKSKAVLHGSLAAAVAFLLVLTYVAAAQSGVLGQEAYGTVNGLLTNRLDVWTDVGEYAAQDRMLGTGPVGFETIVSWNVQPDGSVVPWFTYAEHSILLSWLLETGIVGMALFGLAAAMVAVHFVILGRSGIAGTPARALIAGCAAVFVAMLSAWPDPLTLTSVTIVAGLMLSATMPHAEHSVATWRGVERLKWVPTATVLAMAVLAFHSLAPHVAMNSAIAAKGLARPAKAHELEVTFAEAYENTHDVFYVTEALSTIIHYGDLALTDDEALAYIRSIARDYPKSAEARTDLPALACEVLWRSRDHLSSQEYWDLSEFFIAKGRAADPDMAIWSYFSARAAYVTHRPDFEQRVARAFEQTQPQSAQTMMVMWVAQGY